MIAGLLIELGWKSALVCGVALLAGQALRGGPAAQRVAVLRAAVAALLLLPLLILTVPVLEIAVLPAGEPLTALPGATGTLPAPIAAAPPATLPIDWIGLAYAAGAALVLLHLLLGLLLLHRWTRHAVPVSDPIWAEAIARAAEPLRRPVRLLVSPRVSSPLSLGIVPATILIGPETERRPDRAAAVIAHEIAHVRRFDWPAMLAARVALALFWFNPLAWLLVAALSRETELAADEEAVRRVARADYAQVLLAVAGGGGAHAACGMAVTRSAMARRIRRVLDAAPRKPAGRLACAVLVGGIPLGIAPLAAMEIVERPHVAPLPAAAPVVVRPAPIARKPLSTARQEVPKPVAQAPREAAPRGERSASAPAVPQAVPPVPKAEAMAQSSAMGQDGQPARGTTPPPTEERLAAVRSLRAAALDYRDRARNPKLSLDIRQGYRNVAASLADEADKLEKQAQQLAGVY